MKFKLKVIRYHKDPEIAIMEHRCDPGEPHDVLKELEVDVPEVPEQEDSGNEPECCDCKVHCVGDADAT